MLPLTLEDHHFIKLISYFGPQPVSKGETHISPRQPPADKPARTPDALMN